MHRLELASVAAALLLAGCSRSRGPIVLGLAGPLSDAAGIAMERGARLAVDEIDAQGGVRGRRLTLRAADDSGSADVAARVARALRDDAAVVAVVGHPTSDAATAAASVYGSGRHPLVMITLTASSPALAGESPYVFRVCPTDAGYGEALARFARRSLGAHRAGVIFLSNSDYGRGLREAFTSAFDTLGGTVVEADPYLPSTPSLEPYLARMQRAGVDVLLLAAEPRGAALALREMHALGARWPVLGGDRVGGIEAAGALADGVHVPAAYLADQPGTRNAAFVAAYARAYQGERPDDRAAAAYDAVRLLAGAIATAGTDREAVRAAVARIGRGAPAFDGVTGEIAFDSTGDARAKAVVIGVVRGGRLVTEGGP